jgi:hypothetical protein
MSYGEGPVIYSLPKLILDKEYQEQITSTSVYLNGRWVPARCTQRIPGFFGKLKLAYGVFTGKYDVLDWDGQ